MASSGDTNNRQEWKAAVDGYRGVLKWVIAAYASIGALAAGTAPLASLTGAVAEDITKAAFGVLIVVAGASLVILMSARALQPRSIQFEDLRPAKRGRFARALLGVRDTEHRLWDSSTAAYLLGLDPSGKHGTDYADFEKSWSGLRSALLSAPPQEKEVQQRIFAGRNRARVQAAYLARFNLARSLYRQALVAVAAGSVAIAGGLFLTLTGLASDSAERKAEAEAQSAELDAIRAALALADVAGAMEPGLRVELLERYLPGSRGDVASLTGAPRSSPPSVVFTTTENRVQAVVTARVVGLNAGTQAEVLIHGRTRELDQDEPWSDVLLSTQRAGGDRSGAAEFTIALSLERGRYASLVVAVRANPLAEGSGSSECGGVDIEPTVLGCSLAALPATALETGGVSSLSWVQSSGQLSFNIVGELAGLDPGLPVAVGLTGLRIAGDQETLAEYQLLADAGGVVPYLFSAVIPAGEFEQLVIGEPSACNAAEARGCVRILVPVRTSGVTIDAAVADGRLTGRVSASGLDDGSVVWTRIVAHSEAGPEMTRLFQAAGPTTAVDQAIATVLPPGTRVAVVESVVTDGEPPVFSCRPDRPVAGCVVLSFD